MASLAETGVESVMVRIVANRHLPAQPQSLQRRLRPLLLAIVLMSCLLLPCWLGATPAQAATTDGARLFEATCAGCHPHGGNIIRRGSTLKLETLRRRGLDSQAAIATIAAAGLGQMSGYGAVLGDAGVESVADWVWQQALVGWPRG